MAIGYGIDFGTSTSAVVAIDSDGAITMIADPVYASTSYTVPSSAFVRPGDGELYVGSAAENLKRLDMAAYRTEFKRDFGSSSPYRMGGKSLRTDDLVAKLLAHLKQNAADRIATEPEQVVVTVPASWRRAEKDLMRATAQRAGFDPATIVLITEPVAALRYAFHRDKLLSESTVMVYDLGGGTFDCVLARGNPETGYTLLGKPGGLPHTGGMDFTFALMRRIALGLEPPRSALLEPARDISPELVAHLTFRDECENAKRLLSKQTTTTLYLPPGGEPFDVDRADMAEAIGEMLEETIAACWDLLRANDLTWKDVNLVVPVGGSTRMSLVLDLLQEHAKRVVQVPEPELAVAMGAALHAHDLMSGGRAVGTASVPAAAPVASTPVDAAIRLTEAWQAKVEADREQNATEQTVELPGTEAQERSPEAMRQLLDEILDPADAPEGFDRPPFHQAKPEDPVELYDKIIPPSTAAFSVGMVLFVIVVGGLVELSILSYGRLAAFMETWGWEFWPSGWVAGIVGTLCAAGAAFLFMSSLFYVDVQRHQRYVTPFLTLVHLSTAATLILGATWGWVDGRVLITALVNLAVLCLIGTIAKASEQLRHVMDGFLDAWGGLFPIAGAAGLTYLSALSYGRLSEAMEGHVWDWVPTGWVAGIVGTLCAAAGVALLIWVNVLMDEDFLSDTRVVVGVNLAMVAATATVIVAYNVDWSGWALIPYALGNVTAFCFAVAANGKRRTTWPAGPLGQAGHTV